MNTALKLLAASAIATGVIAAGAIDAPEAHAAGPFDKLKKKAKKARKTANDVAETADTVDAVVNGRAVRGSSRSGVGASANGSKCNANRGSNSNSPCTARAPGHAGVAGPIPAKYASATQCANLGLGNAFVARVGDYTFQQGISTVERSGLLDRRPLEPSNGCVFEGFGIGDVLYVEFDKAKFEKDKYSYRVQCVSYDGSEQLDNVFGPKLRNYGGKDVMLHTGNSTGYTPTASGSNSDRTTAYTKYMDKRGRSFLTVNFEELHTDKSGTDFYCQLFNRDTGKSALALTYRRGPRGS